MDKNKSYSVYIGLFFLSAYLLQYVLGLEWIWLKNIQVDEYYKRWSGLVLAFFIIFQWLLTFSRVVKRFRKYSLKITEIHKWIGAISPLLFYIHSMDVGYGYLLLLSYVFLTNTLLGNINLDFIKSRKEWIFKSWMISHVALSIVIVVMMIFHVGVVFYYK